MFHLGRSTFVSLSARVLLAVTALGLSIPSLLGAAALDIQLTDVALEAGFQDRLDHGRSLVAADWNQDGWVDFYVGNPATPAFGDDSFILWNDGPDGEGRFTFTKGQVLLSGHIAFTAMAVDFDNDGDQDLFIGQGGQESIGFDYLFRNDDGVFVDVSTPAGIRGPIAPNGRPVPVATSSGTWADYDNDGDLDLYTASRVQFYTLQLPFDFGSRDSLFRNNGDGTFTDVSREAGLYTTRSTMTASWGDFDKDGWMDLFVPHFAPSGFLLYRNMGDGTFRQVPIDPADLGYSTRASWASSVNDFNGDGLLDIIAWGRRAQDGETESHALLINRGGWRFENLAEESGLVQPFVPATMGTALGDLDNDGYPEAFMASGGPSFGEADTLFHNTTAATGSLSFEEVSSLVDYPASPDPACVPPDPPAHVVAPAWVDHANMTPGTPGGETSVPFDSLPQEEIDPCNPAYPYRGHGSIFVDYDKDGDVDLAAVKGGTVVVRPDLWSGEPNRLFRNDGGNAQGNWLFAELDGTLSSRDALGAWIEVVTSDGGQDTRTWTRLWQGNTGFSVSGPRETHFGLGNHDTVEEVRVQWPSGARTSLTDVSVNTRLQIEETLSEAWTFEDGSFAGWTPIVGDWQTGDGELHQVSTLPAMAILAREARADVAVFGKITRRSGTGPLSLLGRVSADGRSFYGVMIADGKAWLVRSVDAQITPLGEAADVGPAIDGRAYLTRLEISGDTIFARVNGVNLGPVVDSAIATGSVGLASSGAQVSFDQIGIE